MKKLALLFLFFVTSVFAGDDPSDNIDEPRTKLMDYTITGGELIVGFEAVSSTPIVKGSIEHSGVTTHFNWGGVLDVALPLDQIENFDWAAINFIAGGRVVFENKKDYQLGIGVEVLSFQQNSDAADLSETPLSSELTASGLVRSTIRGLMASFGKTILLQSNQDKFDSSGSLDLSIGTGIGEVDVDVPARGRTKERGPILHARLRMRIFGNNGSIRCSFTNVTGESVNDTQIVVGVSANITDHWGAFADLKYNKVDLSNTNWNFENTQNQENSQIKFGQAEFSFGVRYGF